MHIQILSFIEALDKQLDNVNIRGFILKLEQTSES